jgi:muramoyltetrapeptide carboxypeptidase LdcA involved in peptidoglycan recycling
MDLRFPSPLQQGDVVGVTSPSSGASGALQPRLDVAVSTVRERGYDVVVGKCMDGTGHVSAPAPQRAAELQEMLLDPRVRAIVPPWGGETAIDLIPLLDWDAISAAEPTWVVGFSDMATLITPLTLVAGWATIHGNNLMDTPYRIPEGLVGWLDIVELDSGSTFTQVPPGRHRRHFVDYETHPDVDEYVLDVPGSWTRLDAESGELDVTGRLIGGCIETLANLAGTPYLDTARIAALGDGLIVYVEAAGDDAVTICRNLHGMRLNGVFDGADAVLVARTYAPDISSMTQHDAVTDALGGLGVPLLADVECGHWPPYLPLVNGAKARVLHTRAESSVTQTLG